MSIRWVALWVLRKRAGYKRAVCTDIVEAFVASLTTELRQLGLSRVSEAHASLVSLGTFVQRSDGSPPDERALAYASAWVAGEAGVRSGCARVRALCRQIAPRGDCDGESGDQAANVVG